jgi:hypothetical protein
LAECLRKLQNLNRKQKDLLSVLVVLRGEGVNIERIYHDVVNGNVETADNDSNEMSESISKIRKEERKMYRQIQAMPDSNDIEADNSSIIHSNLVISSADEFSFNNDRSYQEEPFTVRREYKCKKQL